MKSLEMISKSLEDTSTDWHISDNEYYLVHKKSGIELWISGGVPNLKVKKSEVEMDELQRKGLWTSVQECLENLLQEKCKKL